MAEAELARFIDRYTIEYVRFYPHPIERVWRAITDPTEISAWFWTASFELKVGGAYVFGDDRSDLRGVITALDPPRLIRFGGPEPHGKDGYMQFELTAQRRGTRMVFTQHSTPGFFRKPDWPADPAELGETNPWRPGTLSGWHVSFDQLGDLIDGKAHGKRIPESELQEIYREHMRATLP